MLKNQSYYKLGFLKHIVFMIIFELLFLLILTLHFKRTYQINETNRHCALSILIIVIIKIYLITRDQTIDECYHYCYIMLPFQMCDRMIFFWPIAIRVNIAFVSTLQLKISKISNNISENLHRKRTHYFSFLITCLLIQCILH